MSTETAQQTPVAVITRNGIDLPLFETEIKRAGEDKKGVKYPAPDKKWLAQNLDKVTQWIGPDQIASWVNGKLKQQFQGLFEEACEPKDPTKPDGDVDYATFNLEDFIKLATELSPRGESMNDLKDRQADLLAQMIELDMDNPDDVQLYKKFAAEAKGIKTAIESKRRKGSAAPLAVAA